jgi:hypothetical protein
LWFSKDRPSTDIHRLRPVQSPPEGGFLGLTLLRVRHLPPLSFLPTSVVYSANCSAGLLHPAASHGVRTVSVWASLPLCLHIGWSSQTFPGSLLTPFEAFPFLEAASRHRDRCHLAVASSAVSSSFCSASWPCSSRKSVAVSWRFRLLSARCSLGLCSPSRRSPRTQCSSGQSRSFAAAAARLWTTFTEVTASWTWQTLAHLPDLPRQVSPSFGLPEGCLPRHHGCKHPPCRPADRSQPAIELSERASLVLYQCPGRFRRNPAQTGHELQRPFLVRGGFGFTRLAFSGTWPESVCESARLIISPKRQSKGIDSP